MSDIDYKALLAKYIRHVRDVEGVTFIDHGSYDTEDLTNEERRILHELEADDPPNGLPPYTDATP